MMTIMKKSMQMDNKLKGLFANANASKSTGFLKDSGRGESEVSDLHNFKP